MGLGYDIRWLCGGLFLVYCRPIVLLVSLWSPVPGGLLLGSACARMCGSIFRAWVPSSTPLPSMRGILQFRSGFSTTAACFVMSGGTACEHCEGPTLVIGQLALCCFLLRIFVALMTTCY
jgi:H+/Cl- antiporter ClcA